MQAPSDRSLSISEVTLVPCTDLTIGTWRRVASSHHELIAYTCEARRCITWFIRSEGHSFKMEVPYETIRESRFTNVSPGEGSVAFFLERPPAFFVEGFSEGDPAVEPMRYWQASGDWTEGSQATAVLQHCLNGPGYQLAHLVNTISPSASSPNVFFYPPPTPSISDVGSSPEAYSRSFESPVDPYPSMTSMVLRRPNSMSNLRVLHHPSLERLRPSRQASVPMFHSPLSNMSTPASTPAESPRSPTETSRTHASMLRLYAENNGGPQQYMQVPPHAEQLPRLPLTVPNLPGLHCEYGSYPESPYASEAPSSTVSTPGYYHDASPAFESAPAPLAEGVAERPQQPYYFHQDGFQGSFYEHGGSGC